jgi:hypothetical protein
MIEILILSIMGAAYLTAQLGWWTLLAASAIVAIIVGGVTILREKA